MKIKKIALTGGGQGGVGGRASLTPLGLPMARYRVEGESNWWRIKDFLDWEVARDRDAKASLASTRIKPVADPGIFGASDPPMKTEENDKKIR